MMKSQLLAASCLAMVVAVGALAQTQSGGGSGGSGTVTSVATSTCLSGGPITTSGTLSVACGSTDVISWNGDAGISRASADFLYAGNGTAGNAGATFGAGAFTIGAGAAGQWNSTAFSLANNGLLDWSSTANATQTADTSISRDSAGIVDIGTGPQGSSAGGLKAATWNGNILTAGTWTLTGSGGKTLTFSNTMTFGSAADGNVYNFPNGSVNLAAINMAQSWTTAQTYATGTIKFTSTGGIFENGLQTVSGTALTTCSESGSGSPTCSYTASAGSKTEKITLASSASATGITLTFPNAAASMYICTGYDFTTPATRVLQTGGSTTTAVMTYYSLAGSATNPGATDVLYLDCDGN